MSVQLLEGAVLLLMKEVAELRFLLRVIVTGKTLSPFANLDSKRNLLVDLFVEHQLPHFAAGSGQSFFTRSYAHDLQVRPLRFFQLIPGYLALV